MSGLAQYLADADAILNEQPKQLSRMSQYLADADAVLGISPQPQEPNHQNPDEQGMSLQDAREQVIQDVTGGPGLGGSVMRGMLRAQQAFSRPLAWAEGDTDTLNAQQEATKAADPTLIGSGVQELSNLGTQMVVLGPLTNVALAPLRATKLGRLAATTAGAAKAAGISNKARLGAKAAMGAITGAAEMGAQSGLESGAEAIPGGAALGAVGMGAGAPIANPLTRAAVEGTIFAAGPGAMEGRLPTLEESVYGYGFPVIQALAHIKTPSRSTFAKALDVAPDKLPPEFATQESRKQAVDVARKAVEAKRAPEQEAVTTEAAESLPLPTQPEQPKLDTMPTQAEPPAYARNWDELTPDEQAAYQQQIEQPAPARYTSKTKGVDDVVSKVGANYKGHEIELVPNVDSLPDHIKQQISSREDINDRRIRGGYDRKTGKVYLVDDGIGSAEEAQFVLLHELVGHKGIESTLGVKTGDFYSDLAKTRESDIAGYAQEHGIPFDSKLDRQRAASEWLADRIGNGDFSLDTPRWKKLLNEMRVAVYRITGRKFSDAELHSLVQNANKGMSSDAIIAITQPPAQDVSPPSPTPSSVQPTPAPGSKKPVVEEYLTTEPVEVMSDAGRNGAEAAEGGQAQGLEGQAGGGVRLRDDAQERVEAGAGGQPAREGGEQGPRTQRTEGVGEDGAQGAVEPRVTSTKNAVMDAERAMENRDPILREAAKSNEETFNQARAEIADDPTRADKVIAALNDGGTNHISEVDEAILLHEKVRVRNERAAVEEALTNPDMSDAQRKQLDKRWAELEARNNEIDNATYQSGKTWGRFGQFRQRMMREDFSFENLERRLRKSKQEGLSQEEVATIRKAADRLKEIDETIPVKEAEHAADMAHAEIKAEVEAEQKAAKKKARPAKPDKLVDTIIASEKDYLASAKAQLKKAGKSTASLLDEFFSSGGRIGITPEPMFSPEKFKRIKPHLDEIYKSTVGAGKDIAEYIRGAVRRFGAEVKPFVLEHMKVVAKEDVIGRIKERVAENGESLADMRHLVKKLARQAVENGADREGMVKEVHAALREIDPELTRHQARDLISGYGYVKPAADDPVSVKLAQYNQESQAIGKLRDMAHKEAPKASGPQRVKQSDETRRLNKLVNDAKRAGGFTSTDRGAQIKSALDAVKTRLKNEIRDLENAIDKHKELPKRKNDLQYDAEANDLRARRDAKRAEYNEMFPKEKAARKPLTPEQRIKIANASLDRSITKLEADIKNGELYAKKAGKKPTTPELDAKRARLEALRAERDHLRALDTPTVESKKEAQLKAAIARAENPPQAKDKPVTVDTKRVADLKQQLADVQKANRAANADKINQNAYRARLMHSIADMKDRIARGDVGPKKKPEPVKLNEEILSLKKEHEDIQKQLEKMRYDAERKNMSTGQKVLSGIEDIFRIRRGVLTSYDLSAPFRQGGILTVLHPVKATKAGRKMLESFGSEKAHFRAMQEIKASPYYDRGQKAGMFLSDPGSHKMSAHEEAFQTKYGSLIPGVHASERAFSGYLDTIRQSTFDNMAAWADKAGISSLENDKLIANFINIATGRGKLYKFEHAADALSRGFFSPRLMVSRFEYLLGQPVWNDLQSRNTPGNMRMRMKIMQEMGTAYAASTAVMVMAAAATGSSVNLDPRSTDFGKLTFSSKGKIGAAVASALGALGFGVQTYNGKTRVDIWGGLQQPLVLMARTGYRFIDKKHAQVDSKGSAKPLDKETFFNFAWNKAAPGLSLFMEMITGKDYAGKDITFLKFLEDALVPMSVQQTIDAFSATK